MTTFTFGSQFGQQQQSNQLPSSSAPSLFPTSMQAPVLTTTTFGTNQSVSANNPTFGSSLFGNTSQSIQAPSLFGGQAAAPVTFGSGQAAAPVTFGSGQAAAPVTFGSGQAAPPTFGGSQAPSLFGSLAPPSQSTNTFSNTQPSFFGATSQMTGYNGGGQQPLIVPANFPQQVPATPESILRSIKEAWDPNSPQCQFKHYFYNVVDQADVAKYQPGAADDIVLYDHAIKNNPDPTKFVPALATGFPALQKRSAAQTQHVTNMRLRLGEIAVTLDRLQARHTNETVAILQDAKRRLKVQSQRGMQVMVRLHTILSQGTPLRIEEANVCSEIEKVVQMLRTNQVPMLTRVEMLWKQMEHLGGQHGFGGGSSAELDEQDRRQIMKILTNLHAGVEHLVHVLQVDSKLLNKMNLSSATANLYESSDDNKDLSVRSRFL